MTTNFHFGAGLTDFTILHLLSHYYEGEACTSKNLLDLQQSFQPKLTVQVKLYASVSQPGCMHFFKGYFAIVGCMEGYVPWPVCITVLSTKTCFRENHVRN